MSETILIERGERMKTWNDVWKYLCQKPAYNLMQYYVSNPNQVAKAFWHGVLTVLEIEGKITPEEGMDIWNEIVKEG